MDLAKRDLCTIIELIDSLFYMKNNYNRLAASLTDREKQLIDSLATTIQQHRKLSNVV